MAAGAEGRAGGKSDSSTVQGVLGGALVPAEIAHVQPGKVAGLAFAYAYYGELIGEQFTQQREVVFDAGDRGVQPLQTRTESFPGSDEPELPGAEGDFFVYDTGRVQPSGLVGEIVLPSVEGNLQGSLSAPLVRRLHPGRKRIHPHLGAGALGQERR